MNGAGKRVNEKRQVEQWKGKTVKQWKKEDRSGPIVRVRPPVQRAAK